MTGPDALDARRASPAIWAGAALLALALHAAALAAVLVKPVAEDVDETGSPAIEIGLEPASPRQEQTDLPPGPESEASAASPAIVEQKAAVEESSLPRETPTETAEAPDRLVSPDATASPREEEQPTVAKQEAAPSSESVAAEATAPTAAAALPEAPTAVAPSPGLGASAIRVRTTWQRQLAVHLDRNKRYPPGGARRAAETVLSFTLDRTGRVLSSSVLTSSGDPAFDESALAMLRRADPLPAPPPLVADDGLTFTVPVVFRARGRG